MSKKQKSPKEGEKVKKETSQKSVNSENESNGFPENVDFKKFLGCGG